LTFDEPEDREVRFLEELERKVIGVIPFVENGFYASVDQHLCASIAGLTSYVHGGALARYSNVCSLE
jgi:hypothetical protein